jgi:hypothetical protein
MDFNAANAPSKYAPKTSDAMGAMIAGTGAETVITKGLDLVLDAGIEAGRKGDVEALAYAVDVTKQYMERPEMKEAMVKAAAYNRPKGENSQMDLLREKSLRWQELERVRSAEVSSLMDRRTNPMIAAFDVKQTLAKSGTNVHTLMTSLESGWATTKSTGKVGNVAAANVGKNDVAAKVAESTQVLSALASMAGNEKDPELALLAGRASYFLDGKYLADPDAENIFDAATNPNADPYKESVSVANGWMPKEAKIIHGKTQEDSIVRSLVSGTQSPGSRGTGRVDEFERPGSPAVHLDMEDAATLTSELSRKINDKTMLPTIVQTAWTAVKDLAPTTRKGAIAAITNNANEVDVAASSKALQSANDNFKELFMSKGAGGATFQAGAYEELKDVPATLFTQLMGKTAGLDTPGAYDAKSTRNYKLKASMDTAIQDFNETRSLLGNGPATASLQAIADRAWNMNTGAKPTKDGALLTDAKNAVRVGMNVIQELPPMVGLADAPNQELMTGQHNAFKAMSWHALASAAGNSVSAGLPFKAAQATTGITLQERTIASNLMKGANDAQIDAVVLALRNGTQAAAEAGTKFDPVDFMQKQSGGRRTKLVVAPTDTLSALKSAIDTNGGIVSSVTGKLDTSVEPMRNAIDGLSHNLISMVLADPKVASAQVGTVVSPADLEATADTVMAAMAGRDPRYKAIFSKNPAIKAEVAKAVQGVLARISDGEVSSRGAVAASARTYKDSVTPPKLDEAVKAVLRPTTAPLSTRTKWGASGAGGAGGPAGVAAAVNAAFAPSFFRAIQRVIPDTGLTAALSGSVSAFTSADVAAIKSQPGAQSEVAATGPAAEGFRIMQSQYALAEKRITAAKLGEAFTSLADSVDKVSPGSGYIGWSAAMSAIAAGSPPEVEFKKFAGLYTQGVTDLAAARKGDDGLSMKATVEKPATVAAGVGTGPLN